MTETSFLRAESLPSLLGFVILAVLLVTGIAPLSLSFLPQLIGILGCAFLWWQKRDPKLFKSHISLLVLMAIPALAVASSLWSVETMTSIMRAVKIGTLIISYVPLFMFLNNLPEKTVEVVKKNFALPLIVLAGLIAIELNFNFPIGHFICGKDTPISRWELNKQVSELLLLTPLAIFFSLENKKPFQAGLLAVLVLFALYATASQAAQLAVVVMALVFAGMRLLPKLSLPVFFVLCAILLFGMPWIAVPLYEIVAPESAANHFLKEASANARLEVWYFVAAKIMENPWIGHGIDTTRSILFNGPMVYYKSPSVLHPHNVALQLWIEFGILGPLLGTLVLFFMYRYLKKISKEQQILSLIILSGTLIFLSVSWSIWSSWLVGLVMLLISFATARSLKLLSGPAQP